jgi:hypothetical protein
MGSESTDAGSVTDRPVPLTRMTLRKEGREMAFAFRGTDRTEEHATSRDMLATDGLGSLSRPVGRERGDARLLPLHLLCPAGLGAGPALILPARIEGSIRLRL